MRLEKAMVFLAVVTLTVTPTYAQRRRRAPAQATPTAAPAAPAAPIADPAAPAPMVEPAVTPVTEQPVPAAPDVAAAPAVTTPESDARTQARAQYAEGQRLFAAQDFAGAEHAFKAAYTLAPSPAILLGVAAAEERRGMPGATRRTLERYLQENPNAADRARIEARMAALTPGEGQVQIDAPAGAHLFVDGIASEQALPGSVTLSDGEYVLRVEQDGKLPSEQTVAVLPGSTQSVAFALSDAPTEPALASEAAAPAGQTPEPGSEEIAGAGTNPERAVSPAVWVAMGVTAVGLLAGTIFGFQALTEQSNFDLHPSTSGADRGENFSMVADLSFALAAGAALTGIVLYLTSPTRPAAPAETATATASARLVPVLSTQGGGAVLQGSF